jgi:hypothetical protein
MPSTTTDQTRRLLYVANEDFTFLLNRLPMDLRSQVSIFDRDSVFEDPARASRFT